MISRTSTSVLTGAIVLGVLLLVFQSYSHLFEPNETDQRVTNSVEPAGIVHVDSISEISSLRLEASGRILDIERVDDNGFRLALEDASLPARTERVKAFMQVLLGLERSSQVTDRSDRHAELGVAEGTPFNPGYDYSVTVTDRDGRSREVLFGLSREARTLHVRLVGEETVYRSEDDITFYIDQEPVYWAEMRLFGGQISLRDVEFIRMEEVDDGELVRVHELSQVEPNRFERSLESQFVGDDTVEETFENDGRQPQDYRDNEELVRRVLSLEAAGFLQEMEESIQWRLVLKPVGAGEIVAVIDERTGTVYPVDVVRGDGQVTAAGARPPLAVRADLFSPVLERMFPN